MTNINDNAFIQQRLSLAGPLADHLRIALSRSAATEYDEHHNLEELYVEISHELEALLEHERQAPMEGLVRIQTRHEKKEKPLVHFKKLWHYFASIAPKEAILPSLQLLEIMIDDWKAACARQSEY